jgi:hypothetical protein
MNRTTRLLPVVVVLTILTGCGGPKPPLEIAGKTIPMDVAFTSGNKDVDAPAVQPPPSVVDVRPVSGGVIVVPRQIPPEPLDEFPVPPPPPAFNAPCADPQPFQFPKREAMTVVTDKAPAGKYRFRQSGKVTLPTATLPYFSATERSVGNITESNGVRTFDVADSTIERGTVTTFRSDASEVAISGLTTVYPPVVPGTSASTTVFAPLTPLRILPLPPQQVDAVGQPVNTWRSVAIDPRSATTMTVDGTVLGKERVNACGEVIDTWLAELAVRTASQNETTTATWRINVATGYGGFIVAENWIADGTRTGLSFHAERALTINEVPPG